MASTEVLELLLTARYVGRPAFNSFSRDIEGIVSQSNALTRVGALFNALGDAAIAGGLAVAAGLGAAAKQASEFEQSMLHIQTVTKFTGPQMQTLQDQILNVADQYGQNAQDIAQSSYFIISGMQALGGGYQDVINNQILPAMGAYVAASQQGQLGSITWADAVQKTLPVMVGMHQGFQQWANDLGILTMAEKSGLVSQQSLITGLTRFAPMAGLINMPFDQAVAITGALASSGVIGARSGTELTTGIRTLLSGKGASLTQLQAFGLSPESFINTQTGGLTDLPGIAAVLLPHLAGLDMTQRIAALNNLFGATGGRAFNQLLSTGKNGAPSSLDIYQNLLNAENPKGGAANAMFQQAAALANGPQGTVNKLMSQLQTLAITIGQQVLPVLIQFAQWLTGELAKLQAFTQAHPEVVKEAMKAVPALIGGGIGLKMLGGPLQFLGGQMGMLSAGNEKITGRNDSALTKYEQALGKWKERVSLNNQKTDDILAKDAEQKAAAYETAHAKWLNDVANLGQTQRTTLNQLDAEARRDLDLFPQRLQKAKGETIDEFFARGQSTVAGLGVTPATGESKAAFLKRANTALKQYHADTYANYVLADQNARAQFAGDLTKLGSEPQRAAFMTPFEGQLPLFPVKPTAPEAEALQKGLFSKMLSPFKSLAQFGFGMGSGATGLLGKAGRGFLDLFNPESDTFKSMEAGSRKFLDRFSAQSIGRGLTNRFPSAFAAREAELGARDLGAVDAHPNLGFIGGLGKDVGGMALSPLKAVGGGIMSLVSGIPSLIGLLPALATGFMTVIVPLALIAGAVAIVVLAFTRYRKETMAVLGEIGAKLNPMFQAFAGIVKAAWEMIQGAWKAAQPAIDKAMNAFLQALPKIVPLIEILGAVVGTVFAIIIALLAGVANAFLSALPDIIGFFSGIISFVGDFAKLIIDLFTNWKAIPGDFAALWQDVLNIFGSFFSMIWDLVSGFVMGIIHFFQYLWDVLTGHSIIPDMMADILMWFMRLPGQVFQVIVGLIEGAINLMGQFAAQMVLAGINIMQGLINGLLGAISAVTNAIGTVAQTIWQGITSFFGIASPSTLMATAGMNIDQGLAQGIAGSAQLPASAAASMATSVNSQFTSMATTASQTATTIQTSAQKAAAAMRQMPAPTALPTTISPTATSGPTNFTAFAGSGATNAVGAKWQPGTNGQLGSGVSWQQAAGASANTDVFSQPGFQLTPNLNQTAFTFWNNYNTTVSNVTKDVQDKTGRMVVQVLRQYTTLRTGLDVSIDKMDAEAGLFANVTPAMTAKAFSQIPGRILPYQLQILQQVRKQMADMNTAVTNGMQTAANNAYQVGIGISQGMANGIYARKQAALLAADDLAASVDTQFRGRLQIQSPSRLFFQHGANTVLGYIQGLLAHHADLNKTWDELGIPSTTSSNGNLSVGTLQVGSVNGLPSTQAATSGPTTYQRARAIQYERLNQRTNVQPISQYNLLQQLDLQYRYATQQTA